MTSQPKASDENPRLKIIELLKYSSAAYVESYENDGDESEAAKTSLIYLKDVRKILTQQREEIVATSKIDKEKIQHKPNLNIEDFQLPKTNENLPTSDDIQKLFNPNATIVSDNIECNEIDFTKDFEDMFELTRKSISPQSSQENLTPNKRAKMKTLIASQEIDSFMEVEPELITQVKAHNEIDSFMESEPITSSTQIALSNINNFFNMPQQKNVQEPHSKTSKDRLGNNFSKAWSQEKEQPKPNIAKLKTIDAKFSNPWATKPKTDDFKSLQNRFVPNKSKKDVEEVKTVQTKSISWNKPNEKKSPTRDENSMKNLFNANNRRVREQPQDIEPQKSLNENSMKNLFNVNNRRKQEQTPSAPPPEPVEEKTPFTGFRTARQELTWQEANRNIRPQGLSKRHCPSQSRSNGGDTNPLHKKFQIPFPTSTSSNSNYSRENGNDFENPLLRGFDKNMLEKIKRDIVAPNDSQTVSWNDIAGLNNVKDLIHHSIVIPTLNPDVCGGLRRPPRAFLLFGPPGTGKTLIGKCIANEVDATFMSISASTLTSKWIGESETLVRAMFAYAKVLQPCVIFFDEVDSLLGKRDSEGGSGSESMNRLKTEFLIQLDGANSLKDTDKVILIGATNRPHAIDEAMIRRFTRRILIPLPNVKARMQLILNLLEKSQENHSLTEDDLEALAERTEGYSGADLKNLAVEASHIPFRKAVKIHGNSVRKNDIPPTSLNDFLTALKIIRTTVSKETVEMLEKWNRELGSGAAEYSDSDD